MLTIVLVVLVIFLFLRSLSATIIPSVAVPLSLVGTFAVMYALGYSLDNLSLMALTISTGFVVDDAIVMVENISRYLEEGDSPMQAALKGAQQIGFTILSLTVSLIAVLIPLLFMGNVVGRLFREFAVTLAVTIVISAVVSLTLTPMMASRILKHNPEARQGRLYKASEHVFERMIAFYGRTFELCPSLPDDYASCGSRDFVVNDFYLHNYPQRFLSDSRYRRHSRYLTSSANYRLKIDGRKAAGDSKGHSARSCGRKPFIFYWCRRNEYYDK